MSGELLAGAGKVPVGAIAKQKNSHQSPSLRKGQILLAMGGSTTRQCKKCGKKHPPRKCPACRDRCNKCKGMGHFARICRTENPGRGAHTQGSQGENIMKLKGLTTHVVIVIVQDLRVTMNCMRTQYK